MNLEHWVGRYVTVIRINDDRTYSARLDAWDCEQDRIVLGPKLLYIPIGEILKIVPSEPGPFRRGPSAGIQARIYSVGYIIREPIQYANAIHFHSPVMVWRGNQLLRYRTTIVSHTEDEVVLRTGERLSKQEHRFVVRSIRGN